MLFDARSLAHGQKLHADVCIVGAGAAGIAIAREFMRAEVKVILLEGGGLDFDHRTQSLYQGEISGRDFPSLEFTRRRQFGGSTATWFGRCRPLDESDFERHEWVPASGWPISYSDLKPYYERAKPLFELDDAGYESNSLDQLENYTDGNALEGIETRIFQFSPPTRFGERYKGDLQSARNIQVFLHANATNIELGKDGNAVAGIRCSTLTGKNFLVHASLFVLTLGGLETTRLMLASRDVHADGIGNQHDLLGRFFMDHLSFFDAEVRDIPERFPASFFKLDYSVPDNNLGLVHALGLSPDYRRKHGLLNAGAFFVKRPAYKLHDLFFSKDMQHLVRISEMIRHARPPSLKIFETLGRLSSRPHMITRMLAERLPWRERSSRFGIQIQLECAPNPASRITLSEKRDALGMNRIDLDWRLTRLDLESYRHFRRVLFDDLARMGFQVRGINHDLDDEGWPVSAVPLKHHSGTTRMHVDPRHGVVDEACRVHNVNNLFVASSSVFPTIGMANPTLTIAALAIRVADTIKQRLQH